MINSQMNLLISDFSHEIKNLGIDITAIVLFGSQSNGTATSDSDIDLAIISPSFNDLTSLQRRKIVKPALYHIIKAYQIPVDLILLTPHKFETERSIRMSFLNQGIPIPVPE